MRAGRLRHRCNLVRKVPTTVDGNTTIADVPVGTVWGAVEPIRGREALIGGAILAETDTRIVLRWNNLSAQITARDVVQHAGVSYNIYSIANPNLKDRELELLCKSGVNNG